jgi:hypothetical protein
VVRHHSREGFVPLYVSVLKMCFQFAHQVAGLLRRPSEDGRPGEAERTEVIAFATEVGAVSQAEAWLDAQDLEDGHFESKAEAIGDLVGKGAIRFLGFEITFEKWPLRRG